MTLSRFLRDFLYIPLGGNRGGRLLTYRNLMHHDGAGRAVARGGVDVRARGARSTASASSPSTRSAAGLRTPGVAALGRDLPPRRVRLDPVPLAEPRPRRQLPVTPRRARATRRCGRTPVVLAIVVVIGLQLLPARRVERLQFRIERLRPLALVGRASPCWSCSSAPPCPARASPRSSTSASDMSPTDRRQPDEPLRRARPAPLPRARRDRRRRARGAAARAVRGRVGPARGRADEPGRRARRRAGSSASRRAGSPTSCRSPALADDATAWLSPDEELDEPRTRSTSPPATGTAAAPCRRSRPTPSTRADIGAKPDAEAAAAHAAGHRRLAVDPARRAARAPAGVARASR